MTTSSLPSLVQRFVTERLITQQGVSPHTVAGYRDTFRLLFRFTTTQLHRAPSALRVEDLDVSLLERFLEYLERDRRNHPRTRNHRLAALHGFFRYVALAEPAVSLQCQRILAIPSKRFANEGRWNSSRRKKSPRWSPRRTRPRGWDNAIARCS